MIFSFQLADRDVQRLAAEEKLAQMSGDVLLGELESTHRVRFLDLDKALEQLKQMNKRQHEVATLRFFGCLKWREIAEHLDISVPTAEKDWQVARAWLHKQLTGEGHEV
jgi:DNA-directed RNA polymerase specialized sigma24 family protein